MFILYRILTIFLNVMAIMLGFSLLMSLAALLSSPVNLLSAFIIISILLYTWFSNKFSRQVLLLKQPVKHSMYDWIRVNGIVCLIYSIIITFVSSFLLMNPGMLAQIMQNMPANMPVQAEDMNRLFIFVLVYGIIMLVHVLLTFNYIKKNRSFFVETKE